MSNLIGQTIYVYTYRNYEKKIYSHVKPEFTLEVFEVIGENDKRIVINDSQFSTIEKIIDKSDWNTTINVPRVSVHIQDKIFGTGIYYCIYSTEKVKASKIKAAITQAVKSKLKFFSNEIDLSVITDEVQAKFL